MRGGSFGCDDLIGGAFDNGGALTCESLGFALCGVPLVTVDCVDACGAGGGGGAGNASCWRTSPCDGDGWWCAGAILMAVRPTPDDDDCCARRCCSCW